MLGPQRTTAAQTPGPGSIVLWGVLAAAAGLATATLEPNVLEEGIVVHTAERMAQGEHLYRDVVSHTAPLPYELLAALFGLLGTHLAVARGAIVVCQVAGTLATFALARRAGAGVLAHAAAAAVAAAPVLLIPLYSTYFYTTLAFYLGLAAVYTGLRAPDSWRWSVGTGVLLAAIALCKQSTGVVFAAALLAAAAATAPRGARLRTACGIAAGGAGLAILTLGLYALRGDLRDFLWSQIELALVMGSAESFQTPFINLWPPGELEPIVRESWVMYLPSLYHMRYGLHVVIGPSIVLLTQVLYALPFAVLLATIARGATTRVAPAVWLHGAFLAAMTFNLYPRADWGHLVVALPPSLVQGVLLIAGFVRHDDVTGKRSLVPRVIALGLIGALALGTTVVGSSLHRIAGPLAFGPRVPLRPVSRAYNSPAVPRVIHYLRKRVAPGEPIFVARQEPLLYFATGTTNPTPFEGVLQGVRELQEPRILAGLEDVRFIVMSDIDQPLYTYYSDELPAVWAYFERHFRIPRDYPLDDHSWITVARRVRDRGETLIDFADRRDTARRWQRNEDSTETGTDAQPQRLAARHFNRPLPLELGARGGGVDFALEIPADARFHASVGYRGLVSVDHQYIHPAGTTAVVSIRTEGATSFQEIARIEIDDGPRAGRRWTPVVADLDAYAGQRAMVRLEFRARAPLGRDRMAWFGSPRIVRKP